jgi:hypothetical protein
VSAPDWNPEQAETRLRAGMFGRFLAEETRAQNMSRRLPGTRCATKKQAKRKDLNRMVSLTIRRDAYT